MKALLLVLAEVLVVGWRKTGGDTGTILAGACNTTSSQVAAGASADAIVEKAIREGINKPTGELTKEDLEKLTELFLVSNQLTEVPKGLEKLTQLKDLNLTYNELTNVKGL